MGVYVVRTSSLNDKHSCQLFRKVSSLVLLSSSVSTANLSCLLATTFSSLRSTSPRSGVGNAAAAAVLAAAPFRPRFCGKASSEPYNSAAVGKGSTTPVIE